MPCVQGICRRGFVKGVGLSELVARFSPEKKAPAETNSESASSLASKPGTLLTITPPSESGKNPAYSAFDMDTLKNISKLYDLTGSASDLI